MPGRHVLPLGELDAILGLHIRRAHGAVQRHFQSCFSSLGLSQKQVSVMWLVGDHPGATQSNLAQTLDMDRATTMAIVHNLEGKGFLKRASARDDARKVALWITEAGSSTLAEAKAAIADHETWLKSRFTPAEVDQLIRKLRQIYG